MPLIQLQTHIAAPIDRVFDLARSIDAHTESAGKSGERAVAGRTFGLMELDDSVTWEARHLGVKQRLTVKITAFDRPRVFEDTMVRGAFASIQHRHTFELTDDGTRMLDAFHFTAPLGPVGRCVEWLFLTAYMRRFLATRNAVLKEMAESETWRRFLGPQDASGSGPNRPPAAGGQDITARAASD